MDILDIILIGVALAMDACALTISNCTVYKCDLDGKKEWAMPIAFAIFQGIMPLIGFLIGSIFAGFIGKIAGFLTAGIFFFLSGKIIVDNLKGDHDAVCPVDKSQVNKLTFTILLVQGFATSIDALAVGITFISLPFSVFIAVAIISLVTAILVSLALIFGKTLGKLFGSYAEWIGAGILLILAIKSLVTAIIEIL